MIRRPVLAMPPPDSAEDRARGLTMVWNTPTCMNCGMEPSQCLCPKTPVENRISPDEALVPSETDWTENSPAFNPRAVARRAKLAETGGWHQTITVNEGETIGRVITVLDGVAHVQTAELGTVRFDASQLVGAVMPEGRRFVAFNSATVPLSWGDSVTEVRLL